MRSQSWHSTTTQSCWPVTSACAPSCPTPTSGSRWRRRASRSRSCGRCTGRRSATTYPLPTCSGCCCAGGCWNRRASRALRDGPAAARQRCSGSRASAWRSPTSSPCSALHAERQSLGRSQAVQQYLDRGELVPDEIVLDMVRQALVAAAATGGGYALDGIPRNMRQACATHLIARELGMTTNVALRLQVEGGELVRRLLARAALEVTPTIPRRSSADDSAVPPGDLSHCWLVRRARHPGVGGCHASARTGWPGDPCCP